MAGFGDSVLPEGSSTTKPPGFNGENFTFWKMRMKTFIKASEYGLWDVIEEGNYVPYKEVDDRKVPKERNEFTDEDKKLILLNDKAINIITCALSQKEYFRVSSLETAKEMWEALEVAHEGTSGVKESRVNTLKTEFELFRMIEGESVRDMEVRFSHLINHLTALGQKYNQKDQVRKILDGLTKEWEPKVTAIEETKGESMQSVTALFGSLSEYESKLKYKKEMKEKSRKGIALKAMESEEDDEELDDEEMGLIIRKFKKMYRSQNRRFPSKRNTSSSKEPKDPVVCFECKKPGHIRPECPQLVKKEKEKKKEKFQKRRAFVSAIWGDSSSEGEQSDNETANICLVAQEEADSESEEVTEAELSYDELLDEYNALHREFVKIVKEVVSSRKKIRSLEERVNTIPESLSLCEKCEENEREKCKLRKTLERFTKGSEMLEVILGKQKYVSDKSGIGYEPSQEKERNRKVGSKPYLKSFRHTIPSSNPYTYCSYCNRKGHSTTSCFYRKNGPQEGMKWVPKGSYVLKEIRTNQKGPRKVWVPKFE